MILLPFLLNKALLISLTLIAVGSATVYGGIKAGEYRDTQIILQEAQQLSTEGKYQEAIIKLNTTENKWGTKGIKEEVKRDIEENKLLIESSKNYELGKELFDKGKYEDAVEILKKVDIRNANYPRARSLIELAEDKIEKSNGRVAGISTQTEVKVKTNTPVETPIPIASPTPVASPIPQPTPIDPGKTAEMRNLIVEAKRLAAIRDDAVTTLNWYQENQPHCPRTTDISLRPDQNEQIYNSCIAITQPYINQNSKIIAETNSKIRDLGYRLNILAAECPKCWEEAKKIVK